jgi:hypothetical protein
VAISIGKVIAGPFGSSSDEKLDGRKTEQFICRLTRATVWKGKVIEQIDMFGGNANRLPASDEKLATARHTAKFESEDRNCGEYVLAVVEQEKHLSLPEMFGDRGQRIACVSS